VEGCSDDKETRMKSAAVYYDESTYLFAGANRNTNAGMQRPSPTFAGLGFWPVPSGKKDSNPALGV